MGAVFFGKCRHLSRFDVDLDHGGKCVGAMHRAREGRVHRGTVGTNLGTRDPFVRRKAGELAKLELCIVVFGIERLGHEDLTHGGSKIVIPRAHGIAGVEDAREFLVFTLFRDASVVFGVLCMRMHPTHERYVTALARDAESGKA